MPDPDIPPVVLTDEMISEMLISMPKLPDHYRATWSEMKLDDTVTTALLSSPDLASTIDRIYEKTGVDTTRRIAFWFLMVMNEKDDEDPVAREDESKIRDESLIELSKMVDDGELSSTSAKEIFLKMQPSSESPRQIAESQGLIQVNDNSAIEAFVDEVMNSEIGQKAIADIKAGNAKASGFIVGQVMKLSRGQANPQMVQDILSDKLK